MTPLNMAAPGRPLRVANIRAGRGLVRRLADLGLTPGVQIRLVNTHGPGPLMVEVRGSKIALGHGISQKIMVTEE